MKLRTADGIEGLPSVAVTPDAYLGGMFSIIKVLLILLKHAGEIPTNDQLRRAGLEPMRPEPRMPYPSPLVFRRGHHRRH
jgi:hypothetical protein